MFPLLCVTSSLLSRGFALDVFLLGGSAFKKRKKKGGRSETRDDEDLDKLSSSRPIDFG